MSVLSDLEDKFENLLTVDATPSTPRIPVEDNLLDLFEITGSPTSKFSKKNPLSTSSAEQKQKSECKVDPTADIKFPNGKSSDLGDDVDADAGEQKKNTGFKKKSRTKGKSSSAINYNIVNSSNVKIGPRTSFICNLNQHVTVPSDFPCKAKIFKHMPPYIKDLSESQEEISHKDMLVIKQFMGSGWRDVARELGYSEGQIDQFQENFSTRGMDEIVYQFLLDWKRANSKDAKLGILVSAMWSCHEYDCVKQLAKTHKDFAPKSSDFS